ncbi:hypothetical protein ACFWBF_17970 [Streptomyces sp. NPDC060028]|uniref:hypothetical protein n=1 Tax=Streptomyces sp. NPDC060028 TaxID=3347041 RepID=UPI0036A3F4EB
MFDAELVEDEHPDHTAPLPATRAPAPPPRYALTRDTVLAEGELPPPLDVQPAFTERDLSVSAAVKDRFERRGAKNTRLNRDSSRTAYERWCADHGRIARPTTTTANLTEYVGHLIDTDRYKPDTCCSTYRASSPGTRRANAPTTPSPAR